MPYEGEKGMIMQIWIRFVASAHQMQDIITASTELPHSNEIMYRVTVPQRSLLSHGDS
jgi:hypothetical protein